MTDLHTNRYDMQRAVLGVLDTHADAWAAVPVMQSYRDRLAAHVEATRQAAQTQSRTSEGATAMKAALRDDVADRSWRLGQALAAWARTAGRPEVAAAVGLSARDFRALRDAALADYSEVVVAEARQHLPGPSDDPATGLGAQGVTAAFVDELDALDDDFAAALSTPREAIAARKSATRAISASVAQAQALLADEVDPTVAFLAPDAPAFAQAYRDARIIVDRGRAPSSPDDPAEGDGPIDGDAPEMP